MPYAPKAAERSDRYLVKVDDYVQYHSQGYVIVRELVSKEDVRKLQSWADDIYYGRELLPGLEPLTADNPTPEQLAQRIASGRIHQLHRQVPTAEWGLLHPRVLDVVEALAGPDVSALQSMLFFNPPERGGQGWHQDSYYIRTFPDTLIGAWIALDVVDEENGCLWVSPGSHAEPVYPPKHEALLNDGSMHASGAFEGLFQNGTASVMDDERNQLTGIAARYPAPVPAIMKPGDVLFFHSHVLHRSHSNRSMERFRRALVCHYCNARSWVPWNHGEPYQGDAANEHHILARGATHLPYAKPEFNTQVDLNTEPSSSALTVSMMGMDGMMGKTQM